MGGRRRSFTQRRRSFTWRRRSFTRRRRSLIPEDFRVSPRPLWVLGLRVWGLRGLGPGLDNIFTAMLSILSPATPSWLRLARLRDFWCLAMIMWVTVRVRGSEPWSGTWRSSLTP